MSIFRREPESFSGPDRATPSTPPARAAAGGASTTVIASGSRFQGEVGGDTDLVVEGELVGQVRLEATVRVGESGVVQGQIAARTVIVAGAVRGDINGRERVEIQSSGQVEGDVVAPRVVIAEGAFLKGRVEMADDPAEEPAPRTKTASGAAEPPGREGALDAAAKGDGA